MCGGRSLARGQYLVAQVLKVRARIYIGLKAATNIIIYQARLSMQSLYHNIYYQVSGLVVADEAWR